MITPTVTAKQLDRCLLCHHLILTAFVYIKAVRKTNYVTAVHARCAELAESDLPTEELEAAKAEHIAGLLAIEALFLPTPATAAQVTA